jgi:hypothetical protein
MRWGTSGDGRIAYLVKFRNGVSNSLPIALIGVGVDLMQCRERAFS